MTERTIVSGLQPGRVIRYGEVSSFVAGLDAIVAQLNELAKTSPQQAVVLCETFLAGCYEKAEEIDDSDGDFGTFVRGLFGVWTCARQAADADPNETVGALLTWMEGDPYGFCDQLERDLVKILDKPGLAVLERRLREGLEVAAVGARRGEESPRDGAYARRRREEMLKTVLVEQRKVDAYVELCEKTELTPQDCLTIAEMLRAKRKAEEALAWVERGLELCKKKPSSFTEYDLTRLCRELLQKLGRSESALESAWEDFTKNPHLYSYEELMRYVPKRERAAWHQKAMDAAAEGGALQSSLELWHKTNEIERLVVVVRNASDGELEAITHYATEPVAKRLSKEHPDLAAKVYRSLGLRILKAKKYRYYGAALSHFEQAKRCYERAGLHAVWQALASDILVAHRRKTAFMPGFERLVTGRRVSAPSFLERAKARWPRRPAG